MSNFTEPLSFYSTEIFHEGRRVYRLSRDLIWEVGFKGSGDIITVEKNFLTDFLSVPAIVRFWVDNDGPYAAGGALHDKLYRTGYMNRKFADAQLYDAVRALGCGRFKAFTIWAAVRLFGGFVYKKVPSFLIS